MIVIYINNIADAEILVCDHVPITLSEIPNRETNYMYMLLDIYMFVNVSPYK